jgi:hypothetical protein
MNLPTRSLLLLALLPLAGCLQDSASYAFPEKDHAITLVRNQTWFWQDTLEVEVMAVRLPECSGGLTIKNVPLATNVAFYQAPDEYPEALFLLKPDQRVFAVSTQSCRVQEFKEIPANLGVKLGTFLVRDDVFKFVPADAGKPVKE